MIRSQIVVSQQTFLATPLGFPKNIFPAFLQLIKQKPNYKKNNKFLATCVMGDSDNTAELRSSRNFTSNQCKEIEATTKLYRAKMVKKRLEHLEKLSAIDLDLITKTRNCMAMQGTLLEALAVKEKKLKEVASGGFKQHQKRTELAIQSLRHQF